MNYPLNIVSNLPGWTMLQLRDRFNLKWFVETGTYYGNTAEATALVFDRVLTVECCNWDFMSETRERLGHYPHVTMYDSESVTFLMHILPLLSQPTLFYLDAHWSGQEDQKPRTECPLLAELDTISSLDGQHCIVIDDLPLFQVRREPPFDPDVWPSIDDITAVLDSWTPKVYYDFSETEWPFIIVTPERI